MTWPLVKMSDTYLGLYDGPHGTPRPSVEGRIFLGIGNITDDGHLDLSSARRIADDQFALWTKRVTPQPTDIVFTYEATLNRYAIIPNGFDGCLGRRVALIRPNPKVADYRFLFYSFFSREWRETIERNRLSGATVDRVPLSLFPNFAIRLPSLPAQRRIADILSAYDDLIENNLRRIDILEDIARRLFDEWFIKFQNPGNPQPGTMPGDWQVSSLGELADIQWGDTSKTKASYTEVGFPAFSASGCDGVMATYDFDRDGVVLSAIGANCGKTWITYGRWSCIKNTMRFWSKVEPLSTEFLYLSTLGKESWPKRGAAQPFISLGDARNIPCLKPDNSCSQWFGAIVKPMFQLIRSLGDANANLRATRDLLLPKLISGEIEVRAAKEALEAAAA